MELSNLRDLMAWRGITTTLVPSLHSIFVFHILLGFRDKYFPATTSNSYFYNVGDEGISNDGP